MNKIQQIRDENIKEKLKVLMFQMKESIGEKGNLEGNLQEENI